MVKIRILIYPHVCIFSIHICTGLHQERREKSFGQYSFKTLYIRFSVFHFLNVYRSTCKTAAYMRIEMREKSIFHMHVPMLCLYRYTYIVCWTTTFRANSISTFYMNLYIHLNPIEPHLYI